MIELSQTATIAPRALERHVPVVLLQICCFHQACSAGAAHVLASFLERLACMQLHSMPVRLVRCSSCQHSDTLETICFLELVMHLAYNLLVVKGWSLAGGAVLQISFR